MTSQHNSFWENFQKKDFVFAQKDFDALNGSEKQSLLSELFQKSQYHRTPDMVAVLYRKLHDEKSFEDFHQAWFPPKKYCDPIEKNGAIFQQFFPATVRVINAVNINDPKEIISIGLTWVENESQGQKMWEVSTANNDANQERANNIATVSDNISSKLYQPKTDDNLGISF